MIDVLCRSVTVTNTDPQRRCYNGVNFSEKITYGEWTLFGSYGDEATARRIIRAFTCDRYQYKIGPRYKHD